LRHRNGAKGLSRGDGGDTATIRPLKRLLLCIDARHGLKQVGLAAWVGSGMKII